MDGIDKSLLVDQVITRKVDKGDFLKKLRLHDSLKIEDMYFLAN